MVIRVEINNSGGDRWVSVESWKALREAGWFLMWPAEDGQFSRAEVYKTSVEEAIDEFEQITGCNVTVSGCPCCGPPFTFVWREEGSQEDRLAQGRYLLDFAKPRKVVSQ